MAKESPQQQDNKSTPDSSPWCWFYHSVAQSGALSKRALPRRFGESVNVMHKAQDAYIHSLRASQLDLTKFIYQGDITPLRYLQLVHGLDKWIERVIPGYSSEFDPKAINLLESSDIFNQRIRGVSLRDIEVMPFDGNLKMEDIQRINKLFKGTLPEHISRRVPFLKPIIFGSANENLRVRDYAVYLGSIKFASQGNTVIPKELQPLQSRLSSYFDYYTKLLLNPNMTNEERADYFLLLMWGDPHITSSFLRYIPGRLGITPSSAMKLYAAKILDVVNLFRERVAEWAQLRFANIVKNAYPNGNLPPDLLSYQELDVEADKRAAKILLNYFNTHPRSREEVEQDFIQSEQLTGKLRLYRKVIDSQLSRGPRTHRRITYALPSNQLIRKVILTSQNKDNLIFIMFFNSDEKTHLTLEIGKTRDLFTEDKVYGMPPILVVDHPESTPELVREVLAPLIGRLVKEYPEVEPVKPSRIIVSDRTVPLIIPAQSKTINEPKVSEKKKRNRAISLFGPVIGEPNLSPDKVVPERQFVVIYSRRQVKELLGKKISDKIVDQILKKIKHFEFEGSGDIRKIENGEDEIAVRSGDYRIILHHRAGRFYTLHEAGDRKDIYGGWKNR